MRKLGLKIIIGYLLLTATLCAAVWFIVRSTRSVSLISDTERAVSLQRQAAGRLQAAFLDHATRSEHLTLRYADDGALEQYLLSTARIDTALTRLRLLTADSLRRHRLDSLRTLVVLKRDATLELIDALRSENRRGTNLEQQISLLRSGQKPVSVDAQVEMPADEADEQIIIRRRQKGFFKRLGDAFRPAKDDTVHVAVDPHVSAADTATAKVNISDTLAHILADVHRDLARDRRQQAERISRRSDALRATGAELSRRMAALLEGVAADQQRALSQATEAERSRRKQAALQMAGLAVLTTLLSLGLFVWLWRDMSRANRYRRALERAKAETEELMRRREQLLLTISHDIKSPVNSILGYLRLLPPTAASGREMRAIDASAHHLLHLVTALLDYHKLEAADVALSPAPTRLHPLLVNIAVAFTPLTEAKGLRLRADLSATEGLTVLTDAFRLRQVVENLLSNAVKYTARGEVSLSAAWNGTALTLTVRDTGCGLSSADLERIFEPFTRVKGSEGIEGTGLGLSITQKLVALLGGTLTAQSEAERGSTFTVTLPCRPCTEAEAEAEAAAETDGEETKTAPTDTPYYIGATSDETEATSDEAEAAPSRQTPEAEHPQAASEHADRASFLVIALIDDDCLQLQLSEATLRNVTNGRARIHTFVSADALFSWLESGNRPDLLLTDIEMPTLTGYEVLRRVHSMEGLAALPVIATTSHQFLPAAELLSHGFACALFKPFTQNALRNALYDTLGQGRKTGAPMARPKAQAAETPAPDDEKEEADKAEAAGTLFAPLLAFADGDAEAERAILTQFRKDCALHLDQLSRAIAERNKAEACRLAHKLLPTFALLCSPALPDLRTLDALRGETEWHEADAAACERIRRSLQNIHDALA